MHITQTTTPTAPSSQNAPKLETYGVIQVSGGKFHRPQETSRDRMAWFRPMVTACNVTITPLNVFNDEAGALDYTGGNRAHLCLKCFPAKLPPLPAKPEGLRVTRATHCRVTFANLAIGDKFHCGKSNGIGATRGVVSWEVLEKTSKSEARVIENHGAFRGNTLKHLRTFSAGSTVFTNI